MQELTKDIQTHTGNEDFDAYCAYTYMDNLLRGGYPIPTRTQQDFSCILQKTWRSRTRLQLFLHAAGILFPGKRKLPGCQSESPAGVLFAPFVGRKNIQTFYSLIQLDGYNPLGVEMTSYTIAPDHARMILEDLPEKKKMKSLHL